MASSTARGTAASRNWLDWSTLDWKHSTHFCHSKQPTVVRVRTPGYQSKEFWPFGTSDFFLEPPPSTLPHYTHTFPPSNWDHAFWCHHTYFLLQNTDICFKQLKKITFKNPAIFPDFHKINLYVIIMTYVHTHTHTHSHPQTHRCGTHGALNGCQYKEEAANKEHFVESLAQTGSAQQQKHPSTIPLFLTNM